MAVIAHTVTARKARRCGGYVCDRWIKPGDEYARHVAFPGDDANNGPAPWVLRICRHCHTEHGQEMPPRRTRRRRARA